MTVTTSVEVLEQGQRVLRVVRWSHGWMFLSASESDSSEPVALHCQHLLDVDPTLAHLRLKPGQYGLRTQDGQEWHVYGPMTDDGIDEALASGAIDRRQEDLGRLGPD